MAEPDDIRSPRQVAAMRGMWAGGWRPRRVASDCECSASVLLRGRRRDKVGQVLPPLEAKEKTVRNALEA